MADTDPKVVVEALIEAFNRRDSLAVAALLHDDVVCAGIPMPPAHGKAATLDMLAPFLAAEAIDWQLHAVAVNRRTVHTERTDRFRFSGLEWTEVRAAGIFEIAEDGRILGWRDYFDMAELVAAMPATP
ncbi:limonene-1,2-epoxide hydrolase family protein [Sphingobium sp.]|uniref:limonene-1,2-epoxide hydrolase family protein n=1 Tax=Sphingobium sp. TaxID=1912891 RepID=UPI002C6D34E0|nr:limonene-1,2-epoxide hydrolase family protein [Sphingobium sp.]HUD95856.1 limonene-1,2-epoxide hydrolase family protein [Sphingobium sp.]